MTPNFNNENLNHPPVPQPMVERWTCRRNRFTVLKRGFPSSLPPGVSGGLSDRSESVCPSFLFEFLVTFECPFVGLGKSESHSLDIEPQGFSC